MRRKEKSIRNSSFKTNNEYVSTRNGCIVWKRNLSSGGMLSRGVSPTNNAYGTNSSVEVKRLADDAVLEIRFATFTASIILYKRTIILLAAVA